MARLFLDEEATFQETTAQTEEATLTEIVVIFTDTPFDSWTGSGWAKTNPEDDADSRKGRKLAFARALQDVAAEMINEEMGKKSKKKNKNK